jgi:hypothetical protein
MRIYLDVLYAMSSLSTFLKIARAILIRGIRY